MSRQSAKSRKDSKQGRAHGHGQAEVGPKELPMPIEFLSCCVGFYFGFCKTQRTDRVTVGFLFFLYSSNGLVWAFLKAASILFAKSSFH